MKSSLKVIWFDSARLWAPVLKRVWPWLLFSITIEEIFSYGVGYIGKVNEKLSFFAAALALLFQLLLSAVGVIIVNQIIFKVKNHSSSNVIDDLKNNLKHIVIESTRAMLPVILKLLLFIVPGLIEAVRLYFVPYVAQFDRQYKAGHVDALERSRALVRNRFWVVTGILILNAILSMVPRFCLESIDLFNRPAYYVLVFLICLSGELYSDIVLFSTYIRLEEFNGDSVSLP
jgi:hypothetical protein